MAFLFAVYLFSWALVLWWDCFCGFIPPIACFVPLLYPVLFAPASALHLIALVPFIFLRKWFRAGDWAPLIASVFVNPAVPIIAFLIAFALFSRRRQNFPFMVVLVPLAMVFLGGGWHALPKA